VTTIRAAGEEALRRAMAEAEGERADAWPILPPAMTTDPRTALERLRATAADGRLGEVCRRHDLELLVVFGSAIDPDEPAPHDLDLAYRARRDAEISVPRLLADLVQLAGSEDLDLLDLARASTVARDQALRAGEPLFEGRPGAFAGAQAAAMTLRMDSAWLRQLSLETMAR
jgi:hypothetical protein